MITFQSRPHDTSSLILWSYHLGRDEARAAIDPSVFTIAEKALDETHTDSPSAAPMVRTGTDPSSRGPEPRLCTYRVCTYRVLSQLNVSEHFITSCLCKVAAAILVTILCPWSPLGWSKSPPTRHNRL